MTEIKNKLAKLSFRGFVLCLTGNLLIVDLFINLLLFTN